MSDNRDTVVDELDLGNVARLEADDSRVRVWLAEHPGTVKRENGVSIRRGVRLPPERSSGRR